MSNEEEVEIDLLDIEYKLEYNKLMLEYVLFEVLELEVSKETKEVLQEQAIFNVNSRIGLDESGTTH